MIFDVIHDARLLKSTTHTPSLNWLPGSHLACIAITWVELLYCNRRSEDTMSYNKTDLEQLL